MFRTELRDDIQFIISGGATSAGFFRNVGQTGRQGIELALDRRAEAVTASAGYTYLAATFRTPVTLNSPDNTSKFAHHVPDVHRHSPASRITWSSSGWTTPRATTSGSASICWRNQAPTRAATKTTGTPRGPSPAMPSWGLDARYRAGKEWEFFLKATNILDRRYSTFGVLGRNVFTGPSQSFVKPSHTRRGIPADRNCSARQFVPLASVPFRRSTT